MIPERSNWIGLVCWGLILWGLRGLCATMREFCVETTKQDTTAFPVVSHVVYAVFFGGYAIMVVCGICMYERQGWARYVYLIGVLPLIALRWMEYEFEHQTMLAHPPKVPHHDWSRDLLVLQMILFLISAWILFMHRARRYYHPPLYVDE